MGDRWNRLGSVDNSGLESSTKEELCMDIDHPFKENLATPDDRRKVLNKVVPAVVVLRTTACPAFDTESAGACYMTGFVVDKCRGIILSKRHVVKSGPVVAEAMFVNREEVPVYPIYRNPENIIEKNYVCVLMQTQLFPKEKSHHGGFQWRGCGFQWYFIYKEMAKGRFTWRGGAYLVSVVEPVCSLVISFGICILVA